MCERERERLLVFKHYTIRSLDNKLPINSDIDQYKVVNIQEHPLDSGQLHLDLMCFPALFPTQALIGENHAREVKINHASLLNKGSHFRKDDQYVFYLLWKKEMSELSAGIYVLKNTR